MYIYRKMDFTLLPIRHLSLLHSNFDQKMVSNLLSLSTRSVSKSSIYHTNIAFPSTTTSVRHFNVTGQDAIKLIKQHTSTQKVQANSSTPSSSSSSSSLKLLLHADRRGKIVSSNKIHYGPALLGTSTSRLETLDHSKFGQGELGILQAQKDDPKSVIDLPFTIEHGLKADELSTFLSDLTSKAKISIDESVKKEAVKMIQNLWSIYSRFEGVWFTFELHFDEQKNQVNVRSPFLEFDDFGVKRVPELKDLYANRKRDENSAKAEDGGLFYIKLPQGGNVGSFGYGAGNAMATMDGLALAGGRPANFLDGGGGANKQNARLAIETLNRDENVKAIFVNTFGGITQTDVVAEGILEAVKENNIQKPIVVRILGTGAERAKQLLSESDIDFTINDDFKQAARKAVERANQ